MLRPSSKQSRSSAIRIAMSSDPDDEIMIRGDKAPEISNRPQKPDKPVLICMNGNITLPLIGRVKAGGQQYLT